MFLGSSLNMRVKTAQEAAWDSLTPDLLTPAQPAPSCKFLLPAMGKWDLAL